MSNACHACLQLLALSASGRIRGSVISYTRDILFVGLGTATRLLRDWPELHFSRFTDSRAQAPDFYPIPFVVLSVEDVKALLIKHAPAPCMTTAQSWDQVLRLSHQRHQRVQARG